MDPGIRSGKVTMLSLVFLFVYVAQSQAEEQIFSSEELEQLNQGLLVTRPQSQLKKGMFLFGGNSWQLINAKPQEVWQSLLDVERFPSIIPKTVSSELLSEHEQRRVVAIHQKGGPFDINYRIVFTVKIPGKELLFRIDSSHDGTATKAWGFFHIAPYNDRKSILSYGVLSDIGSGSVQGMIRPLLQEKLLKVPFYLKRYLERGGKFRYTQNLPTQHRKPKVDRSIAKLGRVFAIASKKIQ
ncbi:MAG: hypothetical protein IPJ88_14735 [Myxococcales bacterium]|nr:MAG: hypothetical protein IPJ88_14735 [Myxococcales bacterium]